MSTVLATDSPAYLAYQAYDLPGNLLALETLSNGLINKPTASNKGMIKAGKGVCPPRNQPAHLSRCSRPYAEYLGRVTDYMKGIISHGDPERETLDCCTDRRLLPYTRLKMGSIGVSMSLLRTVSALNK